MLAKIDPACMCRMADNVISKEAASIEGITSEVAGDPEISPADRVRSRVASSAFAMRVGHARRKVR
jgi:hypothetical protein